METVTTADLNFKYFLEDNMKLKNLKTIFINIVSFLILAASSIVSAAPPEWANLGKSVEVIGELKIYYVDDFENNKGSQYYILHDKRQGKHFELKFEGKLPKGAVTGSSVRIRGIRSIDNDNQIYMEANSASSIEVLAPASILVSGEQKTIVLVADFNDTIVSCPVQDIEHVIFTDPDGQSVNALYRETSLDNIHFSGTVAGPYTIDYSSTATCNVSDWALAAEEQAIANGINLADYNRKVYVLPKDNGCGSIGLSTVGGNPSQSWIFRCDMPDVIAHELGHSLGMGHAGNETGDYNDTSDIMGFSGPGLRQINGPHQEQMGWRDPQQITEISTDGTYDIAPLELDMASSIAPQLLKIRKPDTAEWYYLSFRQAIGFDASLSSTYLNGLSIHQHAGDGATSKTVWIDTLADGENYSDTVNELSITQIGNYENYVSVEIAFSTSCTRNTPTINVEPLSQTDLAGTTLSYDLSITNNDTTGCLDSSWILASNIPADWSEFLTSNEVTIASGSTAIVNWEVTSAITSADGNYDLSIDMTGAETIMHDSQITANYSVTTPEPVPEPEPEPVSDVEPPTSPSELTAALLGNKISLSWQPSTDNTAVAGYRVFRNNVQIASTASTSYSDSDLTKEVTYTYYTVAYDAADNKSLHSNTSSIFYGKVDNVNKPTK